MINLDEPGWLDDVRAWVAAALGEDQAELTFTLVRGMAWAAVYRVESPGRVTYFKACAQTQYYEPPLLAYLTERAAGHVVPALAVDAERGWMLLPEGGRTLADLKLSDPRDVFAAWSDVLSAAASLQRATETDTRQLLAMGVPDARFSALPALFDELLRDPARLWVGAEQALTAAEYDDLLLLGGRLRRLFERAAAVGIPDAFVHEEAHQWHVFVNEKASGPDRYRFFDWGDVCISHPFMWAMIPLRDLIEDYQDNWAAIAEVRDAYLAHWADVAAASDLQLALDAAMVGGAIARTRTWVIVMQAYGAENLPEAGRRMYPLAVRYWLTMAQAWLERHEAGQPLFGGG